MSAGSVARYELDESVNGAPWTTLATSEQPPPTAMSITGRTPASYSYRVRACNNSGCSGYTAAKSVSVVAPDLSAIQDVAPVAPTLPAQEMVGAVPGTPAVEGGAGTYRIPIELPPGRAGMQPEVALSYSSRNGNGIAGVGWALAASSSIYRCPRTLAQDGANRSVQHLDDRLCLDGQRLVTNDAIYGGDGSHYRTEIESFARITLTYPMNAWQSFFTVEHKSGRVGVYETRPYTGSGHPPDTWYLMREYDRQGNCIQYNYGDAGAVGPDRERVLTSIVYTGTMSSLSSLAGGQCLPGSDSRAVEFRTENREDKRITYSYGVASISTVRLSRILTRVGSTFSRVYDLRYTPSAATRRSLLTAVALCEPDLSDPANPSCGARSIAPTNFAYNDAAAVPRFDWAPVVDASGNHFGTAWQIHLGADYDGDGTRDHVVINQASSTPNRHLYLSRCPGVDFDVSDPSVYPLFAAFGTPESDGAPLGYTADMNEDGKVDVLGITKNGKFAFAGVDCHKDPGHGPVHARPGNRRRADGDGSARQRGRLRPHVLA